MSKSSRTQSKARALSNDTQSYNVCYRLAYQHYIQKDWEQAEVHIDRALMVMPHSLEALNFKAVVCAEQARFDQAEQAWLSMIELDPSQVQIWSNLGNLYRSQERYTQALDCLNQALKAQPNFVDALLNLAVVHHKMQQPLLALKCYEQAIALEPTHAQLYFNRACVHQEYLDMDAALLDYKHALSLQPTHADARANLLFILYYHPKTDPKLTLALAKQLGQHLSEQTTQYTDWPQTLHHNNSPPDASRPLKIGWVSSDLRSHPVSLFIRQWLGDLHAQSLNAIELHAFSNNPLRDEVTAQLQPHFKTWLDISRMGDARVAEHIHSMGLDILIDLNGHTAGNRLGIFAHKPAPIQITWLGYFGSTGLPQMDYLLADTHCIPDHETHLYSEQIAYLPSSRLHLFKPQTITHTPLPCTSLTHTTHATPFGTPFTFGCFQNVAKINARVLAAWAQILAQAPNARLHIQNPQLSQHSVQEVLRQKLQANHIDLTRVHLQGESPYEQYIHTHAQLDLILDTFPYPGGTTTIEALWQGIPTLTCTGQGMLARQGAQIMHAAQLPEWICPNIDHYIRTAVHYAQDAQAQEQLAHTRAHLQSHLSQLSSTDATLFARNWAQCIVALWHKHHQRVSDQSHQS